MLFKLLYLRPTWYGANLAKLRNYYSLDIYLSRKNVQHEFNTVHFMMIYDDTSRT